MTADFLLELRCEEIPARMQERAREDLARLFGERLDALALAHGAIESFATPRRLALIVRDVAETTTAMQEERKGPRVDAPEPAIQGFLRSTGLTREKLVVRDDGKGNQVLFAVVDRPGVPAGSVLASAASHVIHNFPWPKSMRWGAASISTESLRWVRPLQGILALLGEQLVLIEVAGIKSGHLTVGHRFHAPDPIAITSAATYADQLREAHVIVDGAERRAIIAVGAKLAAQKAGLALIEDEGLLYENAGLTEWPVPLLGRFDEAFLSVPPEVIQLTARVNQKYFVCSPPRHGEGDRPPQADGGGEAPQAPRLANAFICVANIDAPDGGARIVAGNEKVLAARLSDARFFYEQDLKVPLEEQAKKLEKIVFHEKLGTVADKVERVAKLARWLVESDIVVPANAGTSGDLARQEPQATPAFAGVTKEQLAALAERAARLAKADLVTGMVGEFPELQGVMGGYYAAAQGEDPRVAQAIRDHYKPVGQGDDVPTDPVTVAVSLADKLDTIFQFFSIEQMPTGSKDPFALRRAMLGIIAMILDNNLRLGLIKLANAFDPPFHREFVHPANSFVRFAIDRLKVQQREAGVRHDLIDAVFALGGEDDLVRLLARVHALQSFMGTEDGANLLTGYRRAANILKKEGWETAQPVTPAHAGVAGEGAEQEPQAPPGRARGDDLGYTPEPAEAALIVALDAAEPRAASAIEAEDFEAAMAALATLRAPIDAFFDQVTVNDADATKRAARLALLARMRDAVHRVADFSKIEG